MSPTRTPAQSPRAASDRNLPALLQSASGPFVLESYFAGWDEPWRALSDAAWREIGRALGAGVGGATLETGTNRELATRYGLEIIPTVLVFLRGEVVARFTGTVAAGSVVAAVREAQARARALEQVELELEAATAAHETSSPVPSILRRRANAPALAQAG